MTGFDISKIQPKITMEELIARLEDLVANPREGLDPDEVAQALFRARRAAANAPKPRPNPERP